MGIVEKTWEELGFRIRAVGWKVWVRTLPHPRKVGHIWLPPKAASFYGELPHLRTVYGVVLSAGSRGLARSLKPGDIVGFKRLEFAWWVKLEGTQSDEYGSDDEYVGYIDANHIPYLVEEADGVRVSRDIGKFERFELQASV